MKKSTAIMEATGNPTPNNFKKVVKDIEAAIAGIVAKHGIAMKVQTATLSRTGIVNIGLKGGRDAVIATNAVALQPGQTQAEVRFLQHYRDAGLKKELLHSQVKLDGKVYEVIGLKGRNNRVVLRQPKKPGEYSVPVEQFTQHAIPV